MSAGGACRFRLYRGLCIRNGARDQRRQRRILLCWLVGLGVCACRGLYMLDLGPPVGSLGQKAYHYGRSRRYSFIESDIRFRNEVLDRSSCQSSGGRPQWQRGRYANHGGRDGEEA